MSDQYSGLGRARSAAGSVDADAGTHIARPSSVCLDAAVARGSTPCRASCRVRMLRPLRAVQAMRRIPGRCFGLAYQVLSGLFQRHLGDPRCGHGKRGASALAVFLALAAIMLPLPLCLHAAETESYAITQVSNGPGGGQEAVTRWFVTPKKSRTEMAPDATDPKGYVVVITRRDKGLAWTLFPSRMAYIERALDEGELRRLGERYKADLKVEDLEKERVLGHDCDKQRVRSEVKVGSRKVKSVQTVWQCDAFDVPLRIDGEDGSRTRTTEVKVGPQPDRLFEVPRGYRKADDLMDVMRVGKQR